MPFIRISWQKNDSTVYFDNENNFAYKVHTGNKNNNVLYLQCVYRSRKRCKSRCVVKERENSDEWELQRKKNSHSHPPEPQYLKNRKFEGDTKEAKLSENREKILRSDHRTLDNFKSSGERRRTRKSSKMSDSKIPKYSNSEKVKIKIRVKCGSSSETYHLDRMKTRFGHKEARHLNLYSKPALQDELSVALPEEKIPSTATAVATASDFTSQSNDVNLDLLAKDYSVEGTVKFLDIVAKDRNLTPVINKPCESSFPVCDSNKQSSLVTDENSGLSSKSDTDKSTVPIVSTSAALPSDIPTKQDWEFSALNRSDEAKMNMLNEKIEEESLKPDSSSVPPLKQASILKPFRSFKLISMNQNPSEGKGPNSTSNLGLLNTPPPPLTPSPMVNQNLLGGSGCGISSFSLGDSGQNVTSSIQGFFPGEATLLMANPGFQFVILVPNTEGQAEVPSIQAISSNQCIPAIAATQGKSTVITMLRPGENLFKCDENGMSPLVTAPDSQGQMSVKTQVSMETQGKMDTQTPMDVEVPKKTEATMADSDLQPSSTNEDLPMESIKEQADFPAEGAEVEISTTDIDKINDDQSLKNQDSPQAKDSGEETMDLPGDAEQSQNSTSDNTPDADKISAAVPLTLTPDASISSQDSSFESCDERPKRRIRKDLNWREVLKDSSIVELKNLKKYPKADNTEKGKRRGRKRASESQESSEALVKKDGSKEYFIDRIVGYHRDDQNENWYLVTWKGFPKTHKTWEQIENLTNCNHMLMKYFEYEEPTDEKMEEMAKEIDDSLDNYLMYQKLIDSDFDKKYLDEFSKTCLDISPLFSGGKIEAFLQKIERENIYIIRTLIGMCFHRDWRMFRRAQNYNICLRICKKRNEQLKNLDKVEKLINQMESCFVKVENNVDLQHFPDNVEYVSKLKFGKDVVIPENSLIGCSCKTGCTDKSNCCGKMSNEEFAYNENGLLKLPEGSLIYECHSLCECGEKCLNRVVQHGRKVKLAIFKTEFSGWGVKVLQKVPKGTYMCEYLGELIKDSEAVVRDIAYVKQGYSYLFDLDFSQEVDDSKLHCIDATACGNVARFLNHSCDPNLVVCPVWIDWLEPHLPRIAFFARRTIEEGEEIRLQYSRNTEPSSPGRVGNIARIVSNQKCECGAANCRKWVF